jgi:uncharacterized protein
MRRAAIITIVMAIAVPGLAQPSAAPAAGQTKSKAATALPADAPSREEVLKLFEMLQISKTMEIAIQAAKQQSIEMAEQMIEEKAPDATAEQKKQMREMINGVMAEALGPAAIKEMLEATVPVYQRHLSKSDLRAMMAFYSSPVGQKVLREQPAMVQESMQAAAGIQQRIARTVFMKIDERMEKMMESGKEQKQP